MKTTLMKKESMHIILDMARASHLIILMWWLFTLLLFTLLQIYKCWLEDNSIKHGPQSLYNVGRHEISYMVF